MLLPCARPYRIVVFGATATCLTLLLFLTLHSESLFNLPLDFASRLSYDLKQIYSSPTTSLILQEQIAFWRSFASIARDYGPDCAPLDSPKGTDGGLSVSYNPERPSPKRPDLLAMSKTQKEKITLAHQQIVKEIQSERHALPYINGTRGLVTTAGGRYLPVALVSLRMLRDTGSTLPMQVFLASKDEWDPEICGNVFPALNASCVVLQDIFDGAGIPVSLIKYQFKVMAILLSSYDEVLFLDSDAFPIWNPDVLFDSEPFISTGLVIWPDFWYTSESPLFFDIAGITSPPLNARASAESGEMLYAKSKHESSIMLAAYYNLWGPDFYYTLFTQGGPGEGDKETFVWAATVMNESYHFVRSPIRALGYLDKANEWRGSAMTQSDPMLDYELAVMRKQGAIDQSLEAAKVRPFFIHANHPKFDPATIFDELAMDARTPTTDSDGTLRRVWNADEGSGIAEIDLGFDIERRFWAQILITACLGEGKYKAWEGRFGICQTVTDYWRVIFLEGKDEAVPTDVIKR